jgi:hypothetical protein
MGIKRDEPRTLKSFRRIEQKTHNVSQVGMSQILPAAANSQHDSKDS